MTTFALVHGARHGGWCWERLTPVLERRGDGTVVVDGHSPDLSRPAALADVLAAQLV